SKRSAKAGRSLSIFNKLPMDVALEIFSFLPPKTLLLMVRTNRHFRALLLNPSAVFVWRTSRVIHGVLEPIVGMSEPAWAHLLFAKVC
ncbi:hypothetical protein BDP27DRAFT_1181258, partial [Rhodocollybia butyracea]